LELSGDETVGQVDVLGSSVGVEGVLDAQTALGHWRKFTAEDGIGAALMREALREVFHVSADKVTLWVKMVLGLVSFDRKYRWSCSQALAFGVENGLFG